ncbi:related to Kinesin [Ustilago trichophora]|uniref:Related to Kinesin n=1 Tax=Ustilago trichophora TaxID=86804 RepID=A0A5C3EM37_9BASI|nr:related to Kinesin [Ustilago trichophora]
MSPAVTRATTAASSAGFLLSSPTDLPPQPSSPFQAQDDLRASTPSVVRELFVPRRKPTKPAPYTYLAAEASASVDSLPNLVEVKRTHNSIVANGEGSLSIPTRPASALDSTALHSSPFSVQQTKANRQVPLGVVPPQRSVRTTRSTSRTLAHLEPTTSAPTSAATTPLLKTTSAFVTASQEQPQLQARPRSHTPTTMAARTIPSPSAAAAPGTPKIKAAVSAEVAARIRSPKKHASTSALRATANSAAASQEQRVRTGHPLQQSSKDVEAYAHSSSTWQHDGEGALDGDATGDSSFVYDADADPSSEESGGHDTVQVHVRLRPPKRGEECAWVANPYSGTVALEASIASTRTQSANLGPFTFDGIQTGSANRPVYISVARPLIRAALDGYDAVVFAYGQTASGKTFTLSGDEKGQEAGIIPRAVRDIFRGIKQSSARREYLLRASYLEIWNEVVKDLLEPSNVPQVRDDKRKRGGKGTTVQPLREEIVTSPAQVRELLNRGQTNRHVGATDWNERSSRSHTCFKITIESWERDAEGIHGGRSGKKVTVSELCLIDLAGSEKYVSQGSDRRAEGAHINKSLLTLGKVIYALSEKSSAAGHIPYRDSKLTRILQNSLSGNARVAVVCTINPNPSAVDESLSTLNFAKRIKKVGLNARRNEIDGNTGGLGAEAQALILRYQTEAEALRRMVADLQQNNTLQEKVEVDDERIRELQERLDVIGSLVVRGGRESGDSHGVDSADEDDHNDPLGTRNPSHASSSSAAFTSTSTPTTSRTTSSSSSTSSYARPVSPTKRNPLLFFDDSPAVLSEKLFHANRKIASLTSQLASRPALPSSPTAQQTLILTLQQQVRELEAVCEAQATDAPPKIREDVEREFQAKMDTLQGKLEEKDDFVKELQAENARLRRVNEKLMELAHAQTRDMVENLSPTRNRSPLKGSDVGNTARNRGVNVGGSPTKARPRPMSLFNPVGSGFPDFSKLSLTVEEEPLKAAGGGGKRRSISNDYTLLKMGTEEIEEEILLKSSRISASETFAALPPA